MNRILFTESEITDGEVMLTDSRARHIRSVLKSGVGDVLKTGQVNGPLSNGEIIEMGDKNVRLSITEIHTPTRPTRDLILALPRPKVLNRLLPQISALGVDRLIMCNASKVERYYFDTHVLDKDHLEERLIEGLMQCGDTCLPSVRIIKKLRHFMEDELEDFCGEADRMVLHPGGDMTLAGRPLSHERTVLAIGPEGGWLKTEVKGFEEHGFRRVSLMNRILRSDTATIAALSLIAMKGINP